MSPGLCKLNALWMIKIMEISYKDMLWRFSSSICHLLCHHMLTVDVMAMTSQYEFKSKFKFFLTHKRSCQTNESYTLRCPIAQRQSNIAMQEKKPRRFVQAMQTMTVVPWYFRQKNGLTSASAFMTTDNKISNKFATIKLKPNYAIMLFQSTKQKRNITNA